MELALYDPRCGYYARAARRSGRAGDFFTSVDVGPLFGELLELQIAEMANLLTPPTRKATAENTENAESLELLANRAPIAPDSAKHPRTDSADSALAAVALPRRPFDLVEVGAGSGRLAADILDAARQHHPAFYDSIRLHLVETSEAARRAQRATLGEAADRLVSSATTLPDSVEGVLLANELLDALPTHQVVMRDDGLKEVYVAPGSGATPGGHLIEGPLSTPDLQTYLDRLGVALEPGWRVEINLRAVEWIREAARRLARGFMILIDYGHEARDLYSDSHSAGTLTSFSGHRSGAGADSAAPAWLQRPGDQDITAHVDFTSVRAAAEAEGLTTIAFLDQTYFLLGLVAQRSAKASAERSSGTASAERLASAAWSRALKTLVMPGGLGSTMKVLILGKGVGAPALAGCSFKVRVT
jgi:SAM-dependent MidA family methyltransferase